MIYQHITYCPESKQFASNSDHAIVGTERGHFRHTRKIPQVRQDIIYLMQSLLTDVINSFYILVHLVQLETVECLSINCILSKASYLRNVNRLSLYRRKVIPSCTFVGGIALSLILLKNLCGWHTRFWRRVLRAPASNMMIMTAVPPTVIPFQRRTHHSSHISLSIADI